MVDVVAETDPAVGIEDAKKKRRKAQRCVENNNCEDTPTKMDTVDVQKVAVVAPTLMASVPTSAARKRAHSPRHSPSRKMSKMVASGGGVDNETLIRETEAALKSLSGSWPGVRASYYGNHEAPDDKFENLFDEKHAAAKSRCAATASPGLTPESLKDVITLRGQKTNQPSRALRPPTGTVRGVRREDDGDDSSQELHIDLEKDEDRKDFKKAAMMHHHTGFGPFPPRPTFIGFPGDGLSPEVGVGAPGVGVMPGMDDKPPPSSLCLLELNLKFEEDEQPPPPPPAAASPDPSSKQYTILQPAGAGSRAATALQDVAREGVPAVPRAQSDLHRTFGPLSPGVGLSRGE